MMTDPQKQISNALVILVFLTAAQAQSANSSRADQGQSVVSAMKQEFRDDPRWRDLTIELADGYAYLRGSVEVLEDARQAIKNVNENRRLAGVVSQINVLAPNVPDAVLRLQLEKRLKEQGFESVRVGVRHGVVRITGTITEDSQREDILSSLCSARGVKGVDDRMQLSLPNSSRRKSFH
jgi:osmotically-inducible protein OsmY